MDVTRRGMLGIATAAGAAAMTEPLLAAQAVGASSGVDAEVVQRVRTFAAADLADKGFPGMTLALLAPSGFTSTLAIGLADLERRVPASPDQLFQIGSITKSLTAMALFVLAERGKLNLDARVQDLLPEHPLPPEPITLTHLLDHSSGIPNGLDNPAYIQAPGGRLWTGFTPGSRYSYCNLGYGLLGAVMEQASGMAFPAALETLVLKPLGMTNAVPEFRASDRGAHATGHVRFREDIPWLPKARLAPARWFDFSHAAGSVSATAADMVRYLEFVSRLARGRGAPLFSDRLAERFRTPTIASSPPGARYGNGLHTLEVDGQTCFRHTGGVLGFSSAFTLDREAGVGCYASVNAGGAGNYRPTEITEYAVALLRAAGRGEPLPAVRLPKPAAPINDAARLAGRWLSADGRALTITDRAGALFVISAGRERPLRAGGPTSFVTDHPALDPYTLVFDSDASVLRLGNRLFGRATPPPVQPPSKRLAALAGTYYNPGSWSTRPRIFVVGDRIFLGNEELLEAADGSWRSKSPSLASERVWFQHAIMGRPQVLNVSGTLYDRMPDRSH
jgi:CubicO group peptidase (beta-lactamase class C family)